MQQRLEINTYTPLPMQRRFHESNAMLRLYQGGFGAGKTLAGVWEAIDVSMAYPRNFGIIARRTYRELVDSTQKTFFDVCPPELITEYRARDEMVTLKNGSKIIFRSLDDPNKFRSLNIGWFYIDEASEVQDEDIPTMLVGRLRLANVPWRGGWFTSNPSTVEHWLHEWFVKRPTVQPNRYFMVTARSYDNPYLPPEYILALEQEYSPQWVRRYLMGEFGFIIQGTPVFTNFNRAIHVVDGLVVMKDRPVIRAWDFGFHHPAVLFSQIGPDHGWNALGEKMGDRVLLRKFAEDVVVHSNLKYPGAQFIDIGDPAGNSKGDKDPRTSIEILRDEFSINVRTRRYPKRRLIELIDQRLGMVRRDRQDTVRPVIQIDRTGCPVLIEGLEGAYAWPRTKEGRILREEPIEDGYFEHLQDCAQYTAGMVFLGGSFGQAVGRIIEPRWRF